ncbi:MAG: UTP--glucose-1-phosphate uridylyltransferase [Acidobacteria bacterium]|nr:MAG: UTP--glucose-1-phosphate uridylyltransferase [Acidobacteriota bacterium]
MRIRKAVFPAAGLGTRFLPATKAQPKEMLPLVDKPAIQYVIEEAVASGVETVIIVTGRGKNAIEDHFDVAFELERTLEERGKTEALDEIRRIANLVRVCYVRQKEPLGLGHAVLSARDLVGDEPFAVLLGDDIIESKVPCLKQLMSIYDEHRCSIIAVERIDRTRTKDYGVVGVAPLQSSGKPPAGQGGRESVHEVRDLVEKPEPSEAPSDLAIIGRYILTSGIFEQLESTAPDKWGEIQLTNGLRSLLRKEKIMAYEFEGKRYDTGNKLGFLKATVEFALRREDLGEEFRRYLRCLAL